MATRSSSRLAERSLLPPPRPNKAVPMGEAKPVPAISVEEWSQSQLEEYRVQLTPTDDFHVLVPNEFGDTPPPTMPKNLIDESSTEDSDLLVQSFLETLRIVQTMFMSLDEQKSDTYHRSETYTRQLLYDFMRILFLANKSNFADMHISPGSPMNFEVGNKRYLVFNDGCIKMRQAVPVSFESNHHSMSEKTVFGQVLAQLFAAALIPNATDKQEAYVVQIQVAKVYIYYTALPAGYAKSLAAGRNPTESVVIHRFPEHGFDLADVKRREQCYKSLYSILKYCSSPLFELRPSTLTIEITQMTVINAPHSEGQRYLASLPKPPSPQRTPSPKRPSSPKRKHQDVENESPRPVKRTAMEEPKQLNSFGFGAKITSSPWTVPESPTKSESQPKKTFGFGAAASGVSPFSAVAKSASPWSGWDTQKPATFEKKSLFSPVTKVEKPGKKKEEKEEKKKDDRLGKKSEDEPDDAGSPPSEEEEDEEEGEEGEEDDSSEGNTSPENETEPSKRKSVDMRERRGLPNCAANKVEAGEADEETLFETTCTLYEIDPKTASWVSKGTGIIHVNIDKASITEPKPKHSRLSTLQGTMKVMWNIRLFRGMQLLPRQVSEGDRRMDIYVKMVLVDEGRPKSYTIKLRNHRIMDQLYDAIESAIPS